MQNTAITVYILIANFYEKLYRKTFFTVFLLNRFVFIGVDSFFCTDTNHNKTAFPQFRP